ncbi:MAG: amidohydrolase family protein [Deltaproteobacteria bacterium]|nr:amidohydrolase family protein [Deltaproteobacteria bacterium]
MSLVLFRDTRCLDAQVDVLWDDDRGIAAVAPPGTLSGHEIVEGGLVTPPFAEPHVHLDAALLGARAPNRSGTLREGIANWARLREGLTRDDVIARARTTLAMYREHGCLRVRTHVDTGSLLAVEALLSMRDANLQVVAFPQEGILRAPRRREAWERAVEMGCDAVGAIPHFERTTEEGWESVRIAFRLAEKHGLRVDLHCDETDDPGSRNLEVACAEAMKETVPHVVAGHCTAMHSYPQPYAAKVMELVASAGVQVVCNPLDNVVLQGRYDGYPRRRGLAPVDQLWAQGATVGIGHDSVQDPWYRLGTASLLDAAYMLVHVGQLTSETDMKRVVRTLHTENHDAFGPRPEIAPGARAMLWWDAADEVELLRTRGKPRLLVA